MKTKICIVTGTRAEYDLLKPIIELFHEDEHFELQLIATCMHLSPEFGLTAGRIEQDNLPITDKLEMLLSADTPCSISKSTGIGIMSFADSLRRLSPDLLVVLGDRFETFSAVLPAFIMKIPVIHLHGGETSRGAFDEGIRHAISKMSYLHFTATEQYRQRVIQLGEEPDRVFNVGAIGVENIKKMHIIDKPALEKELDFTFRDKNILVAFHSVTLENKSSEMHFSNVLNALNYYSDLGIIFTKTNADADGRVINSMIDTFVAKNPTRAKAFITMGQINYFNVMRHVDAIVGNSSSGIIEAPSLGIGSINIGDRQTGRIKASSIIDCDSDVESIKVAFNQLYSTEFQKTLKHTTNPYDGGNTSKKIYDALKNYSFKPECLKKKFYDVSFATQ